MKQILSLAVFALTAVPLGCSGSDGTTTGGAGGDSAGGSGGESGSGGGAGASNLVEGSMCTRTGTACDPNCEASCGGSPGCVDLCCPSMTFSGVVCNGACSAPGSCTFHDENDPACAGATFTPSGNGCSIEASVHGRTYNLSVTVDPSRSLETASCMRTWTGAPAGEVRSAGGGPCVGTPCPTACDEVKRIWPACCGK